MRRDLRMRKPNCGGYASRFRLQAVCGGLEGEDRLRRDLKLRETQLRRPTRPTQPRPGPAPSQHGTTVRLWCTEMRSSGTPPVRAIINPEALRHDLRLREPQLRRPTRPTLPWLGPAPTSARPSRQDLVYRNEGRGYTASASHHVSKRGLVGQGLAARPQVIRAPTVAAHPPDPATLRARPNVSTLPPSGRGVPK